MAAFGWTHFLNEFGCNPVYFQAITISPTDSRWTELKTKAAKYTDSPKYPLLDLNILLNIRVPETWLTNGTTKHHGLWILYF